MTSLYILLLSWMSNRLRSTSCSVSFHSFRRRRSERTEFATSAKLLRAELLPWHCRGILDQETRQSQRTASELGFFRGEAELQDRPDIFDDGPLPEQPMRKLKGFCDVRNSALTKQRWDCASHIHYMISQQTLGRWSHAAVLKEDGRLASFQGQPRPVCPESTPKTTGYLQPHNGSTGALTRGVVPVSGSRTITPSSFQGLAFPRLLCACRPQSWSLHLLMSPSDRAELISARARNRRSASMPTTKRQEPIT